MSRLCIATLLFLLLANCSTAPSSNGSERYLSLVRRWDALFKETIALPPMSCIDDHLLGLMGEMGTRESEYAGIYAAETDPRRSSVEHQMRSEELDELRPIVLGDKLALGDYLLRAKCFDAADRTYREVLTTYTGLTYAAYRERAVVGIDDVRRAQKHGG